MSLSSVCAVLDQNDGTEYPVRRRENNSTSGEVHWPVRGKPDASKADDCAADGGPHWPVRRKGKDLGPKPGVG
jgi:hypothetical protein